MQIATTWKPRKIDGGWAIQLFDADGKPINGLARWEGNFSCDNNKLTSLVGAHTEVGGNFYCDNNKLTSLVGAPRQNASRNAIVARIDAIKRTRGLTFADGILAHVVKQHGNATLIRRVGKKKTEWLVTDGTHFAHGATPEEARADMIFKRSSSDTSEFKKWTLDTVVSFEDAILAYRSITGACAAGVRGFCDGKSLPEKATVREIVETTRGNYGAEVFARFFV